MVIRTDSQTPGVRPTRTEETPPLDPQVVPQPPVDPSRVVNGQTPVVGQTQTIAQTETPDLEAPTVDNGVSAQRGGDVQAAVVPLRLPTPDDERAIAALDSLRNDRSITGAHARQLVDLLRAAASRPGGMQAFIALYEASTARLQNGALPLDQMLARLEPSQRRTAQALLPAIASPRPPLVTIDPNTTGPARNEAWSGYRTAHPTLDYTLQLLNEPPRPARRNPDPEAVRLHAAWEARLHDIESHLPADFDRAAVRRWAGDPDVQRALAAYHIDEAAIVDFLIRGGDLGNDPQSPIRRAYEAADRSGDWRAQQAISAVLRVQQEAGRVARADADRDLTETGRTLAGTTDPAERTRLAASINQRQLTRRALDANVQASTRLLRNTAAHADAARLTHTMSRVHALEGALRGVDVPALERRVTELDARIHTLEANTHRNAADNAQLTSLRAERRTAAREASQARRNVQELERHRHDLGRRAAGREANIQRWMERHHVTDINQVPSHIREGAAEVEDTLAVADTVAIVHAPQTTPAPPAGQRAVEQVRQIGVPTTPPAEPRPLPTPFNPREATPTQLLQRAETLDPALGQEPGALSRAALARRERHQGALRTRDRELRAVAAGPISTGPNPLLVPGPPAQLNTAASQPTLPAVQPAQGTQPAQGATQPAAGRTNAQPTPRTRELNADETVLINTWVAATGALNRDSTAHVATLEEQNRLDLAAGTPAAARRAAERTETLQQARAEVRDTASDGAAILQQAQTDNDSAVDQANAASEELTRLNTALDGRDGLVQQERDATAALNAYTQAMHAYENGPELRLYRARLEAWNRAVADRHARGLRGNPTHIDQPTPPPRPTPPRVGFRAVQAMRTQIADLEARRTAVRQSVDNLRSNAQHSPIYGVANGMARQFNVQNGPAGAQALITQADHASDAMITDLNALPQSEQDRPQVRLQRARVEQQRETYETSTLPIAVEAARSRARMNGTGPTLAATDPAVLSAVRDAGHTRTQRVTSAVNAASDATQSYVRTVTSAPRPEPQLLAAGRALVTAHLQNMQQAASTIAPYDGEAATRDSVQVWQAAGGGFGPQYARTQPRLSHGAPVQPLPPELQLTTSNPLYAAADTHGDMIAAQRRQREQTLSAMPQITLTSNSANGPHTDPLAQDEPDYAGITSANSNVTDTLRLTRQMVQSEYGPFYQDRDWDGLPDADSPPPLGLNPAARRALSFVRTMDAMVNRFQQDVDRRIAALERQDAALGQSVSGLLTQAHDAEAGGHAEDLFGIVSAFNAYDNTEVANDTADRLAPASTVSNRWLGQNRALSAGLRAAIERGDGAALVVGLSHLQALYQTPDREDRHDPFLHSYLGSGIYRPHYDRRGHLLGVGRTMPADAADQPAYALQNNPTVNAALNSGRLRVLDEQRAAARRAIVRTVLEVAAIELATWGAGSGLAAVRASAAVVRVVEIAEGINTANRARSLVLAARGLVTAGRMIYRVGEGVSYVWNIPGRLARIPGRALIEGTGEIGVGLGTRLVRGLGHFTEATAHGAVTMMQVNYAQPIIEGYLLRHLPASMAPAVRLAMQVWFNDTRQAAAGGFRGLLPRLAFNETMAIAQSSTPVIAREIALLRLGINPANLPPAERIALEERLQREGEEWAHVVGVMLPSVIGGARAAFGGYHGASRSARDALGPEPTDPAARRQYRESFQRLANHFERVNAQSTSIAHEPESRQPELQRRLAEETLRAANDPQLTQAGRDALRGQAREIARAANTHDLNLGQVPHPASEEALRNWVASATEQLVRRDAATREGSSAELRLLAGDTPEARRADAEATAQRMLIQRMGAAIPAINVRATDPAALREDMARYERELVERAAQPGSGMTRAQAEVVAATVVHAAMEQALREARGRRNGAAEAARIEGAMRERQPRWDAIQLAARPVFAIADESRGAAHQEIEQLMRERARRSSLPQGAAERPMTAAEYWGQLREIVARHAGPGADRGAIERHVFDLASTDTLLRAGNDPQAADAAFTQLGAYLDPADPARGAERASALMLARGPERPAIEAAHLEALANDGAPVRAQNGETFMVRRNGAGFELVPLGIDGRPDATRAEPASAETLRSRALRPVDRNLIAMPGGHVVYAYTHVVGPAITTVEALRGRVGQRVSGPDGETFVVRQQGERFFLASENGAPIEVRRDGDLQAWNVRAVSDAPATDRARFRDVAAGELQGMLGHTVIDGNGDSFRVEERDGRLFLVALDGSEARAVRGDTDVSSWRLQRSTSDETLRPVTRSEDLRAHHGDVVVDRHGAAYRVEADGARLTLVPVAGGEPRVLRSEGDLAAWGIRASSAEEPAGGERYRAVDDVGQLRDLVGHTVLGPDGEAYRVERRDGAYHLVPADGEGPTLRIRSDIDLHNWNVRADRYSRATPGDPVPQPQPPVREAPANPPEPPRVEAPALPPPDAPTLQRAFGDEASVATFDSQWQAANAEGRAVLRHIATIEEPSTARMFLDMYADMTPERRAEMLPHLEEAMRARDFDQILALDRVRSRFLIGTDLNGRPVFGPGRGGSMPQVRAPDGRWIWADGRPVEPTPERRADGSYNFSAAVSQSSDAAGSDIAGMRVEHGTAQVYVDSVTEGPQNVGSGLGGRGLYLAVPGDTESAPRFGGLVAERVRQGQGRHGELPPAQAENAGNVVVMRGEINRGADLHVGRFMIVPREMADIANGRLPPDWAQHPELARQLEREFDVLDIYVPANLTAFGNGRMLVVHESAGPRFITWTGNETLQRARPQGAAQDPTSPQAQHAPPSDPPPPPGPPSVPDPLPDPPQGREPIADPVQFNADEPGSLARFINAHEGVARISEPGGQVFLVDRATGDLYRVGRDGRPARVSYDSFQQSTRGRTLRFEHQDGTAFTPPTRTDVRRAMAAERAPPLDLASLSMDPSRRAALQQASTELQAAQTRLAEALRNGTLDRTTLESIGSALHDIHATVRDLGVAAPELMQRLAALRVDLNAARAVERGGLGGSTVTREAVRDAYLAHPEANGRSGPATEAFQRDLVTRLRRVHVPGENGQPRPLTDHEIRAVVVRATVERMVSNSGVGGRNDSGIAAGATNAPPHVRAHLEMAERLLNDPYFAADVLSEWMITALERRTPPAPVDDFALRRQDLLAVLGPAARDVGMMRGSAIADDLLSGQMFRELLARGGVFFDRAFAGNEHGEMTHGILETALLQRNAAELRRRFPELTVEQIARDTRAYLASEQGGELWGDLMDADATGRNVWRGPENFGPLITGILRPGDEIETTRQRTAANAAHMARAVGLDGDVMASAAETVAQLQMLSLWTSRAEIEGAVRETLTTAGADPARVSALIDAIRFGVPPARWRAAVEALRETEAALASRTPPPTAVERATAVAVALDDVVPDGRDGTTRLVNERTLEVRSLIESLGQQFPPGANIPQLVDNRIAIARRAAERPATMDPVERAAAERADQQLLAAMDAVALAGVPNVANVPMLGELGVYPSLLRGLGLGREGPELAPVLLETHRRMQNLGAPVSERERSLILLAVLRERAAADGPSSPAASAYDRARFGLRAAIGGQPDQQNYAIDRLLDIAAMTASVPSTPNQRADYWRRASVAAGTSQTWVNSVLDLWMASRPVDPPPAPRGEFLAPATRPIVEPAQDPVERDLRAAASQRFPGRADLEEHLRDALNRAETPEQRALIAEVARNALAHPDARVAIAAIVQLSRGGVRGVDIARSALSGMRPPGAERVQQTRAEEASRLRGSPEPSTLPPVIDPATPEALRTTLANAERAVTRAREEMHAMAQSGTFDGARLNALLDALTPQLPGGIILQMPGVREAVAHVREQIAAVREEVAMRQILDHAGLGHAEGVYESLRAFFEANPDARARIGGRAVVGDAQEMMRTLQTALAQARVRERGGSERALTAQELISVYAATAAHLVNGANDWPTLDVSRRQVPGAEPHVASGVRFIDGMLNSRAAQIQIFTELIERAMQIRQAQGPNVPPLPIARMDMLRVVVEWMRESGMEVRGRRIPERIVSEAEFGELITPGIVLDPAFENGEHGMDTHAIIVAATLRALHRRATEHPEEFGNRRPDEVVRDTHRYFSTDQGLTAWGQIMDLNNGANFNTPENIGPLLYQVTDREAQRQGLATRRGRQADQILSTVGLPTDAPVRAEILRVISDQAMDLPARLQALDRALVNANVSEAARQTLRTVLTLEVPAGTRFPPAARVVREVFDQIAARTPPPSPSERARMLGEALRRTDAQGRNALGLREDRIEAFVLAVSSGAVDTEGLYLRLLRNHAQSRRAGEDGRGMAMRDTVAIAADAIGPPPASLGDLGVFVPGLRAIEVRGNGEASLADLRTATERASGAPALDPVEAMLLLAAHAEPADRLATLATNLGVDEAALVRLAAAFDGIVARRPPLSRAERQRQLNEAASRTGITPAALTSIRTALEARGAPIETAATPRERAVSYRALPEVPPELRAAVTAQADLSDAARVTVAREAILAANGDAAAAAQLVRERFTGSADRTALTTALRGANTPPAVQAALAHVLLTADAPRLQLAREILSSTAFDAPAGNDPTRAAQLRAERLRALTAPRPLQEILATGGVERVIANNGEEYQVRNEAAGTVLVAADGRRFRPDAQSIRDVGPFRAAGDPRPASPFLDARETRRLRFLDQAMASGMTAPQARDLFLSTGGERVDSVTGFQSFEQRAAAMQSAQEYIASTPGGRGAYAEIDVGNLRGLNDALGSRQADTVFRRISEIIAEEARASGVQVSLFRHGGDEMGIIATGPDATPERVQEILRRARTRIGEYVQQTRLPAGPGARVREGTQVALDRIVHPKHPNDTAYDGTTISYGVSRIVTNERPEIVIARADLALEADKAARHAPPSDAAPAPQEQPNTDRLSSARIAGPGGNEPPQTLPRLSLDTPGRAPFRSEVAERRERFVQEAATRGIDRERAVAMFEQVTGVSDPLFQAGDAIAPTVTRAIDRVAEPGSSDRGVVVNADMRNLGGLNAALGATGANIVYADVGRIIADELSRVGADVIVHRQGGAMTIVAVGPNATRENVQRAMETAQRRINDYIASRQYTPADGGAPRPLRTLANPRDANDPGTGVDFGVAQIRPQLGTDRRPIPATNQHVGTVLDAARAEAAEARNRRLGRSAEGPPPYNGPAVRPGG